MPTGPQSLSAGKAQAHVSVGETVAGTKEPSFLESQSGMGSIAIDPVLASTQLDHSSVGGVTTCVDCESAGVEINGLAELREQPRAVSRGDSASSSRVSSFWRFVVFGSKKLKDKPQSLTSFCYNSAMGEVLEFEEAPQRRQSSSFNTGVAADVIELTDDQREKHDRWMRAYGDTSLWSVLENTDGWEEVAWTEVSGSEETADAAMRKEVETPEILTPDDFRPECPVVRGSPRGPQAANFGRLDGCFAESSDEEEVPPLSIGCRSAPAVCYASREPFDDEFDEGWYSTSGEDTQPESMDEESEYTLSDNSDSVFVKEHSTILDVLEAAGELKRQEVVDKIGSVRREMQRFRRSVRVWRLEMESLRTGMYTVTPEIAWLRQRWGVKRRIKNREKLAMIKLREEDYLWFDIPLMELPLTRCGHEASTKLACGMQQDVAPFVA